MELNLFRRYTVFYKIKEFVKEIGKYSFDAMQQKHKVNYKEDNDAIFL